jgi:hypothetical protein
MEKQFVEKKIILYHTFWNIMSRPSRAGRRRSSVVIQSELVNKDHGATENEQVRHFCCNVSLYFT